MPILVFDICAPIRLCELAADSACLSAQRTYVVHSVTTLMGPNPLRFESHQGLLFVPYPQNEGRKTMERKSCVLTIGLLAATGLALNGSGVSLPANAAAPPTITTWIGGLNAPRGLAFDRDGSLYVSESGSSAPGPDGLTQTGRVGKYLRGSQTPIWKTMFESLHLVVDPSQPPDVLGPEGIGSVGENCNRSKPKKDDGCQIRMIMSESHDGVFEHTAGAVNTTQIGHLFALDASTGASTDISNVGDQQYKWTADHKALFDGDFPDSNPFGLLVTKDKRTDKVRTFVADAGANTVSEVMPDGTTRVISYIPNETAPPFRDSTPTCIAEGPDGMLYVGTLHFVANLFVSGPGQSDVWRVDPNANFPTVPTVWARGLTTPTACTFDHEGNFWATEMFQPNVGMAPGDVVRIPFRQPTRLYRMGGGSLPLPGGIAEGPDDSIFVSVNSANPLPGTGAVVKIKID
jgi:sugar lactone lactonase YvrE